MAKVGVGGGVAQATATRAAGSAAVLSACLACVASLTVGLLGCSATPVAAPAASAAALADDLPRAPEAATGFASDTREHKPQRWAVASAHPLASEAGAAMLRENGSAVDAAIAVQMVLTLVEPQSSGIGGGAFLLHWDGTQLHAWDGRETAPAAVDESLFLDATGQPMRFEAAVSGGRSVGTLGAVRMLEAVHRQHGRLPWPRLFQPAIDLAEQGFTVGPRLAKLLRTPDATPLQNDPQAKAYFFHTAAAEGQAVSPLAVGERVTNPALAAVLRRIAALGSAGLHQGPIAADIVRRVREHPTNPGLLSEADLAGYKPLSREPLCTLWRRHYRVCGFPPPSSGHLATMQILGLLDKLPAPPAPLQGGLPSPNFLHRYTEAARLAYADRALYVADPDFAAPPAGYWESLLDEAYLDQRAALINDRSSLGTANAGDPAPFALRGQWAPQPEQPEYGTSHVAIVDGRGHAVSMTTTIEAAFGSKLMSNGGTGLPGGFLLNNELTDFSLAPRDADGRPYANRVEPGKRPRSSMSPTMVFDTAAPPERQLLMVMGSPGGSAIIHYNTKALLGTLAWGLDPQAALDLPNFANDNGPTRLEAGRFPVATAQTLQDRGHRVVDQDMPSGTQTLMRVEGGWLGGADRRREGAVVGESP